MKIRGVIVYFEEKNDGKTTLVFDDVSSDEQPPKHWRHEVLFTSNSYDSETMKNLKLSEYQFARIGESLIIRLCALNKKLE